MRAPAFWNRPAGLAAGALAPAAALYGAIAARRMERPGARAAIPVVCVGNMTVGGSGKTPVALALHEILVAEGRRPAFLTRGYGGRLAGPLRLDVARDVAADTGDEALLLARAGTTVLARDRAAGAALAAALGADVIVMDDGLQNPSLAKDLALAVFDCRVGVGNERVLPAGPLRAPLARQWRLVDAVILVGAGAPGRDIAAEAAARGLPVLTARLVPEPAAAAALAGRRVLAFAGIGRPAKFFDTLAECGAELVAARGFADHHRFTPREVGSLLAEARRQDLLPVTTEKDWVRLSPLAPHVAGLAAIRTLAVRLVFDDPAAVRALLAGCAVRPTT